MTRPEWLAERRKGIGGSDIASLFNVGYGCRRRLFYDKRGVTPDFPREENNAMKLGNLLEPFFADQYAVETKRGMLAPASLAHPEHPELRVNADRLIWDGDHAGRGCLEIKAQGRAVFYQTKRSGLPEDYVLQCQHGMLIHGLEWGAFCVGSRDSGDIIHWDVARDKDICNAILTEGPKFWAYLCQDDPTPPTKLEPDDKRCQSCEYRTTCHGNALAGSPERLGQEYEEDQSLAPLVLEYIERRSLRKEANDLLEETKAELEYRLGERALVTAAGAKVQFYKFTKKEYVVKAHEERPLRIYEAKKV